jgi:hypothetical protein
MQCRGNSCDTLRIGNDTLESWCQKSSLGDLHIHTIVIPYPIFKESGRLLVELLLSTNNFALLIHFHSELHMNKAPQLIGVQKHRIFRSSQHSDVLHRLVHLIHTSITLQVTIQRVKNLETYSIWRILNTVAPKNLTKILSTIYDLLWRAVVKRVILIW